jgi:hypothetical protein
MFAPESRWLWLVALAVALFFPVRQLIWVLAVRREQRRTGGEVPDENVRRHLKSRAGVTSALLCLIFSAVYGGIILGVGR